MNNEERIDHVAGVVNTALQWTYHMQDDASESSPRRFVIRWPDRSSTVVEVKPGDPYVSGRDPAGAEPPRGELD